MINKSSQENFTELSDERLAVLAVKNTQALEVLISRYLKAIYNFIYRAVSDREEAEDLTQEVFVKVWKNLDRFDSGRTFKPWLYKIAKHTYLDYYKKKRPGSFATLTQGLLEKIQPQEQIWSAVFDSPDSLIDKNLLQDKFDSALAGLEPSSVAVIKLRQEAGLTFKTIAQTTGESLNTVKSRYRRAISKIAKIIG